MGFIIYTDLQIHAKKVYVCSCNWSLIFLCRGKYEHMNPGTIFSFIEVKVCFKHEGNT